MTDTTTTATATGRPAGAEQGVSPCGRLDERTLSEQIRGILGEALHRPGLPEHSKARLRALMAEHHDRPALAFLEHLRLIRGARVPEAREPQQRGHQLSPTRKVRQPQRATTEHDKERELSRN